MFRIDNNLKTQIIPLIFLPIKPVQRRFIFIRYSSYKYIGIKAGFCLIIVPDFCMFMHLPGRVIQGIRPVFLLFCSFIWYNVLLYMFNYFV